VWQRCHTGWARRRSVAGSQAVGLSRLGLAGRPGERPAVRFSAAHPASLSAGGRLAGPPRRRGRADTEVLS